jgi:two-component system, sporulation sensor kinase E
MTNFQSSQIQKSAERYQDLFNKSLDPVFFTNNEFNIIDVNPAMVRLFEYTIDEIQSFKKLFCDKEEFLRFNKQIYHYDFVENFETEMKSKSGKVFTCIINFVCSVNHAGIQTYIGLIRNITARKEAEQKLLQAEKLSVTGRIARTIGHEVRNPLTNINLALEQLKDELKELNEDYVFYIDTISRNVKRISGLVDDLLKSSRKKDFKFSTVKLNDVITETLVLAKDRLELRQMQLELELSTKNPAMALDRNQIKVALLNLCLNAIEAMEDGKGVLKVSTDVDEQEVVISLEDNGKGIKKKHLNRLFDPFFSAKSGGMGLGLVTVQSIISGHQGQIEVESEEGQGTCFYIYYFAHYTGS